METTGDYFSLSEVIAYQEIHKTPSIVYSTLATTGEPMRLFQFFEESSVSPITIPYWGVNPEPVVMFRVEWDDPVDIESIVYLNYQSTTNHIYAYAYAYDADLTL